MSEHWPLPLKGERKKAFKAATQKKSSLFVYPTETYYALGCRGDDPQAVEKIFQLKGRDPNAPLLLLVSDWEMFETWAEVANDQVIEELRQHWPGPLTYVGKAKKGLAPELNREGESLGFRWTAHPMAQDLIRLLGVPLVGTSANLSGRPPIREIVLVKEELGEAVDFYLDGGPTQGGLVSTVASWKDGDWQILRQGAVTIG